MKRRETRNPVARELGSPWFRKSIIRSARIYRREGWAADRQLRAD
jgi:hypothetical protein